MANAISRPLEGIRVLDLTVALAGCVLPLGQAVRVDPVVALRSD